MPIGRSGWNLITAFAPHGAIVLAGAMLGRVLTGENRSPSERVRWTLGFAAVLYAASALLHTLLPLSPMFGISKIMATPAWCLRCAALTAGLWLACYLLVDAAGIRRGTRFLARAGTNALFAYVLAPFVCAAIDVVFELTGSSLTYGSLAPSFGIGLARGFTLAFGLTWLAGLLKDKGLDLRL
jgi:predicted acyltransferase